MPFSCSIKLLLNVKIFLYASGFIYVKSIVNKKYFFFHFEFFCFDLILIKQILNSVGPEHCYLIFILGKNFSCWLVRGATEEGGIEPMG